MRKIVLATKNTGKIAEFERLLSEFTPDVKVLGLADFPDMPEVVESGKTLNENARLKAKAICEFSKLPALADDSGLFIDALGGQPGVYSARWAGYEGVDSKMRDLANINIGVLSGQILTQPIGSAGFGYDPIFSPDQFDQSLAQLPPRVKDEVSHRGIALRAIAPFLRDHL